MMPNCWGWTKAVLVVAGVACLAAAVGLVKVAWCGTLQTASAQAPPPADSPSATSGPQALELLREGTQLTNQLGSFRPVGDRVAFVTSDGKRRLIVLENLSLERVTQLIGETPTPLVWSVTGTVTEFRGANYLLVERAVISSAELPAMPGRQ